MTDDQIQHLVLSMEARTDKLDASLANMTASLDNHFTKMERSADSFTKRIERSMAEAGKRTAEGFLTALGVEFSLRGARDFVEHITEIAMNAKKQSAALGVGVETFQAWSIMAKKADIDQDVLNQGLERFTKNVGLAKLKTTEFGKEMQHYLGSDALKGSMQDIFYRFADFLKSVKDPVQRAGLLGLAAGGRGGASLAMAQFFGQGSDALKSQVEQLVKSGEVISEENVEKIRKLDIAWIDLKATLSTAAAGGFTAFVDEFNKFEGGISGSDFRSSLAEFSKWLADLMVKLPQLAPYLKILAAVYGGSKIGRMFGPEGAVLGGVAGGLAEASTLGPTKEQLEAQVKKYKAMPGASAPGSWAYYKLQDAETALSKLNVDKGTPVSFQDAKAGIAEMLSAGKGAGNVDLAGSLDQGVMAYDHAVQRIKAMIDALKNGKGEIADYTAAEQAATEQATLMAAAEADAARKGTSVTAAQKAEIAQLSTQYGQLRAQQAWDKDLASEDARIAKLKAQAEAAGATVRATAELVEWEKLLSDFHNKFGADAEPTAEQHMAMFARAKAAGQGAAGDAFAKALDEANKSADALDARNATVGMFGAQLAAAETYMRLLNAAIEAGIPVDARMEAQMQKAAQRVGEATQKNTDLTRTYQDQVRVSDELRSGLENTLMAGEHGFKSMADAAKQFLLQLVELYVKITAIEPMMRQLFGEQGTSGGGYLGGLTNSLFGSSGSGIQQVDITPAVNAAASSSGGWLQSAFNWIGSQFADGGIMTGHGRVPLRRYSGGGIATSPQAAIFGETSTPEAYVPVPSGRIPVQLHMPKLGGIARGAVSSSTSIHMPISIDARGAQAGVADQIDAKLRDIAPEIIGQAVAASDARFHGNLYQTLRDRY